MKILKYMFILLVLSSLTVAARGQVITVSGSVTDIDSGDPVPFHPVEVFANQDYLTTYYTDASGFFRDSLFNPGTTIDSLTFLVLDCLFNYHDTTVTDLTQLIFVEFDICVDSTSQECQADFIFFPQGEDPYTFLFQDLSTGGNDQWLWEFGDSTFSTEQNPVHTFPSSGTYQVCLTITSGSGNCLDYICQVIIIENTSACSASFTYQLDSLTNEPYRYFFTDLSAGNIDTWHWDFGDGHFSEEQNPVHVYEQGGQYQVCLYVANTSLPDSCFDMVCLELTTASYFDLGGLVYIDDYPLNNPEHEFDTAYVQLYRVVDGNPVQIDGKMFWEYGYYWFSQLLQGDYLVKVSLSEGSNHYGSYFTTYSGDKVFWEYSQIIPLHDSSNYSAEIHLAPEGFMATGAGSIRGYVYFEDLYVSAEREYPDVRIVLMDAAGLPLRSEAPDPSGYFEFTGLPFQDYRLKADATGRISEIILVTLDQSNQAINNVQLVIGGSGIFGIEENGENIIDRIRLYPNPVRDIANIEFNCLVPVRATIIISDITGRICHTGAYDLLSGVQTVRIPAGSLSPGAYSLQILFPGGKETRALKFIR